MEQKIIDAVDQLGRIRAEISHLRILEKDVEAVVRSAAEKAKDQVVEGDLFKATLVVQFRDTIDPAKVRELCHPNTVKACTKTLEVSSVRVSARSTEKREAA